MAYTSALSLVVGIINTCTVKSSMQSLGFILSWTTMKFSSLINPRCMREGYGSRSVCLSVNKLAATYLVYKSKLQCYTIPYGIPNACIVWIPLEILCSPVLSSFADDKLLDFSHASGTQHSIYTKGHVLVLYAVCSAYGRDLVKARPTE